ncbi:MAG: hypothetical protein ACRDTE_11440, partial [Pseudonocardiaceae bacterium]
PAPPWEDDDVRRRTVLGGLPLAGLATSGPLAALVDGAIADRSVIPRRAGAEQVELVRAVGVHAFEMNQRFGGGAVRELQGEQLRWAVGLLDAHVDPEASHDLHSAVGHLARYTAWSSHDMGVDTAARRCSQVALHCADEAGDWSLRAKTLADSSRIAEYTGDGETALTLAQQAMVRPDRLTPLERVWGSAVEAAAHGRRGDAKACLAAIGRTEDHFADAEPANEAPAVVAFYTPAEIAFETGNALWPLAMRGHAVANTVARLRTAADTYQPDRARSRTICLTRLATLQFTQGHPDEAVAVADQALDAADTAQSRWLASELVGLRNASTQHRHVRGVTELCQRLTRALTSD